MKEETLDRTVCRTRFERGCGTVLNKLHNDDGKDYAECTGIAGL